MNRSNTRVSPRLALATVAMAATLASCTAPTTVRQRNRDANVVTQQLDVNDFEETAAVLTQSLVSQGVFAKFQEERGRVPAIGLDRFVNDTRYRISLPLLTTKVEQTLLNSGAAQPIDLNSAAFDELEFRLDQEGRSLGDVLDFTLKSEIIQTRGQSANRRVIEDAYTIQMTLLDYSTAAKAWIGEELVVKQTIR
ncbi:MAG: hypothetical protein AAF937_04840 [Planctomycetota bacterium]